jgi:hypothetical protein
VTTTEETTTTTEDGNTRVTTTTTTPDGNITMTDGPPLSCREACAASHSTEATYVPCVDKCNSGSSSSPAPALCSDEVTTVDDGCTCTYPEDIPNSKSKDVTGNSLNGRLPLGATVTFVCVDGFELDDNQTMTCTGRGFWSNDPPACHTTLDADGSGDGAWDSVSASDAYELEMEKECEGHGGFCSADYGGGPGCCDHLTPPGVVCKDGTSVDYWTKCPELEGFVTPPASSPTPAIFSSYSFGFMAF